MSTFISEHRGSEDRDTTMLAESLHSRNGSNSLPNYRNGQRESEITFKTICARLRRCKKESWNR